MTNQIPSASPQLRPRLVALLLFLATLALYLPAARHDFIWYDDDRYVLDNRVVQHGLTSPDIQWAFTTFYAANWHPLTWLSHMTDCQLFGLNPGPQHLVNALIHAANTALVFLLWWRLTGLLGPAALVAAFFGWHPLHVESVAWIAERKDVLSAFFGLLALLAYADFAIANRRRSWWLALGCFALGLLAKPMLVTLPFICLLLDLWPLNRLTAVNWHARLWEKAPFFALAAVSCAITCLAQNSGHAVASLENVPLPYRLANAVVAPAQYLLKLVWPHDLAVFYPLAPIGAGPFAAAVVVLTALTVGAAWTWRRQPAFLVGWLWFLGALVPVIGLVQVGRAALADRYTYLPAIGLFAALAFGLLRWPGRRLALANALLACFWLAAAACIPATERQLSFWRNTGTLFSHALAVTPDNDIAHDCRGVFFEKQGRYRDALAEYRLAIQLNPGRYPLRLAEGDLLLHLGQPAEALAEIRACLDRNPEVPALHQAAGCALAALDDLSSATSEFTAAERLDPHYAAPHLALAKLHLAAGENDQAVTELSAAVQAEPREPATLDEAAHYLAANADPAGRRESDALALALHACELAGDQDPAAFDILAMAFAASGDFTNALISAQNALEFTPPGQTNRLAILRQRLNLYQNHQPWLESFRGANAPPLL